MVLFVGKEIGNEDENEGVGIGVDEDGGKGAGIVVWGFTV